MNLLVTGGAGYIGSHFCLAAARAGHRVVTFDNLSTGHKEFVKFGPLYEADIRDTKTLTHVLRQEKIDAVVHFAALSIVSESLNHPDSYYSNNVAGTLSLLQAMFNSGINRLLLASSAAVYGASPLGRVKESDALNPTDPYGKSKKIGEEIALDFHRRLGLRIGVLRFFNVIGQSPEGKLTEKHEPETHVVPCMIQALQTGRPFTLYGTAFPSNDGTCVRDYIDVNDLAEVHLEALNRLDFTDWFVSNVGRGQGISVRELLVTFQEVFGQTPRVLERDPRPGDVWRLVADPTYFQTWYKSPLRPLKESLATMLNLQIQRPSDFPYAYLMN